MHAWIMLNFKFTNDTTGISCPCKSVKFVLSNVTLVIHSVNTLSKWTMKINIVYYSYLNLILHVRYIIKQWIWKQFQIEVKECN